MKGFALDKNGDVLIVKNEIQMVQGDDLTIQTVKSILGTNKGEWTFNEDEGINFENILGKSFVEPKRAEDSVYVDKINSLSQKVAQTQETIEKTNELNEMLARRLDGES